jgi:hypothetical protein
MKTHQPPPFSRKDGRARKEDEPEVLDLVSFLAFGPLNFLGVLGYNFSVQLQKSRRTKTTVKICYSG